MNATGEPKVVIVAITKHGVAQARELAGKMPAAEVLVSEKFLAAVEDLDNRIDAYRGALKDAIGGLFSDYDQIIFFVSLGAVVRLIAPHLKSKDEDPGVLVVDDAGDFVIPVLSGHVGGANEYAIKVAGLIDALPVVTTASDVGKTIPVDILGRELGWEVQAPKINITRVSAHVVNEEPVAFVQEAGSEDWWTRKSPLPGNIKIYKSFEEVDLDQHQAVLWVTHRDIDESTWDRLQERLVVYRPPREE